MLEKIPGKPLLHKLRVIHILEADYNLVLKEIFGRRLMWNCETNGILGDLQGGFRKGRSTTRTLLHNELVADFNKRRRINNFIGMTDISGCFDRIIPSLISLLNKKNGCPQNAVTMHATTLQKAKYHLKTKQGVSLNHYQHSETTPIYGNGQGAGDSPAQWNQESVLLFDIYQNKVRGATITNNVNKQTIRIPLAAFTDDTNLFGNDENRTLTTTQLVQEAQIAFSTWSNLLHAAGHFMELEKCSCYLSIWDFQDDGYAFTIPPEEISENIMATDIHGRTTNITKLATDVSQKLLGVMKNPMSNQQDEVNRLLTKSNSMAIKINSHAMTHTEARIAYETFYIPAMRYSLSTTSMNQTDLEHIQKKAVVSILAAMGYNRHMPREVVHSSRKYQGLGLPHLYDLQGCDGTRLFLQEINSENMTSKLLRATAEMIQLESGIGSPIMMDTRALDYIEWGWIPGIREYLQHINGQITNATTQPKLYCENDMYIMDAHAITKVSSKERMLIHRCRIFMQVECVSDIANAEGTKLMEAWLSPKTLKPSKSNKNWPKQSDPGRQAWNIWKKFLINAFATSDGGKLRQPLGKWIARNDNRMHQAYSDGNHLYLPKNGAWHQHAQIAIT
jgi:hypothetical protein